MFKALTLAAILAVALFTVPAWSQETSEKSTTAEKKEEAKEAKLSREAKKFVDEAAAGGKMEVQLGKMAAEKAVGDPVKQFGQRMVTDHGKANEELAQIATQKEMKLPQDMPEKMQKLMDKMSKLSGEEFDKAYMKEMVRDHKKDVKAFEKASKDLDDPELKAFAEKTLPVLQEHLKMAQEIAGQETKEGSKETTGAKAKE